MLQKNAPPLTNHRSGKNLSWPVLVYSSDRRYGDFLRSLTEHVGLPSRLFINVPLSESVVRKYRPRLLVIDAGHHLESVLKPCERINHIPICVVAHRPSDRVGFPERIAYFWRPLHVSGFVRHVSETVRESNDRLADHFSEPQEPFLIGNSPAIREVRQDIQQVSKTDLAVLITGDTGTGKGVTALSLHNNSQRRLNQYLEVNCANVPSTLLESELFGYKKGAFTGAWRDKPGKFQLAGEGTIFLDEVSEMPSEMQAKLLQVLQDGEFSPVGSVESLQSNVRVVAATNANLKKIMSNGRFRKDLYYRLAVITLKLPPLRERPEDIGLLASYFFERYANIYNNGSRQPNEAVWDLLERYDWPGNVRELENTVKSLVALDNEKMVLDDLQKKVKRSPIEDKSHMSRNLSFSPTGTGSLRQITSQVAEEAEKAIIKQALAEAEGNKKLAAKMLGVSYKCLLNKVKEYKV
jgi:two-component system response regulator AtoC